jgi:hypothetical protein
MNDRSENWTIDNIILNLKNKLFFFKHLSTLFKYLVFIFNYTKSNANQTLRDKHKNQKCYIIGNGTSLCDVEIQNIKDGVIFSSNQIILHNNFQNLKIDYYALVEPFFGSFFGKKYVKDFNDLFKDVNDSFYNKDTILFFHPTVKKILRKQKLFLKNKIHFVASLTSDSPPEKLSNNLSGVFNFGQGALSFMIGSAIYMGFNKIVLIGCGYTFNPRQQYHFYNRPTYSKSQFDYSSMLKQVEIDFRIKNLSVTNIEETEENYMPVAASEFLDDSISDMYMVLKKFAESKNVEIINVHPINYSSPIFNGITWDQYQKSLDKS